MKGLICGYLEHTVGSGKIYPKPKIKKTPPTKIGSFFNTHMWVELMVIFWRGVSQAVLEILALKGPKLAQMAKYLFRGVVSQTRPFFHTVWGTEYEFCIKIPNIVSRGSILAHLGQIWVKFGPKLTQNGQRCSKKPEYLNKTFFHTILRAEYEL